MSQLVNIFKLEQNQSKVVISTEERLQDTFAKRYKVEALTYDELSKTFNAETTSVRYNAFGPVQYGTLDDSEKKNYLFVDMAELKGIRTPFSESAVYAMIPNYAYDEGRTHDTDLWSSRVVWVEPK